jgi:death on curing protein
MTEPVWIDTLDVLSFHQEMIARFGGLSGVRDERLLESAMARSQHCFAYKEASIFKLAAEYSVVIVKNHPFLDGNKRAGFMAAALFLEVNGFTLMAPEEEVVVYTLGLAAGEIDAVDYADWLGRSCEKRMSA